MRVTTVMPRVLCLGAILLLSGCTPRLAPNPFEGGGRSGGGEGRSYWVAFEVSCAECSVSWSLAGKHGNVNHAGSWSHRESVWVRRGGAEVARLTASSAPGSGAVRAVRIFVNGKLAAEDTGDLAGDVGTQGRMHSRSVETSVPGPAASPGPEG